MAEDCDIAKHYSQKSAISDLHGAVRVVWQ